jgi:hypothetical protein
MFEAADANKVYAMLSQRYGREYSVKLIDGMIKMRKGWSMGADIRMMSGGSMQGPDEKVLVTQRCFIEEFDTRIIKRTTSMCAVLGVVAFWAMTGDVDTQDLSIRHAATVNRYVYQFIIGGGLITGAIVGAVISVLATILLNTRSHQARNKVFVTGVRTWLNERLK